MEPGRRTSVLSQTAQSRRPRENAGVNMVNVYLFIELLRAANPTEIVDQLKALDMSACKFANVVALADDKIVAQLDCPSSQEATSAILGRISPVEGVVQVNIIAAVRPVNK
jgi:hypothetical protein